MYITKEKETKVLKVGFFGKSGSNTENGARGHFGSQKIKGVFKIVYLSFATIPDMLRALRENEIEKAVVPIENSSQGVVDFSIDALINGNGIVIENEFISRIRHNLIGVGTIDEIEVVTSIPQALSQCGENIKKLGHSIKIVSSDSTSAAVMEVAEKNDSKIAAIGPMSAFEIYRYKNNRLSVLAENIQDSKNNRTRFLILGHKSRCMSGNDKTSLVFGTVNKPGSLSRVLSILDMFHINMTHLVERPSEEKKLGEYVFWVDIDGHIENERVRMALELIAEITTALKILGSYPKAE